MCVRACDHTARCSCLDHTCSCRSPRQGQKLLDDQSSITDQDNTPPPRPPHHETGHCPTRPHTHTHFHPFIIDFAFPSSVLGLHHGIPCSSRDTWREREAGKEMDACPIQAERILAGRVSFWSLRTLSQDDFLFEFFLLIVSFAERLEVLLTLVTD